jgi:hypothetical protein
MNRATDARLAGGLSVALGLGFGPLGVYGAVFFAAHAKVWYFAGFPTYGDGPFETVGIHDSVLLIAGFVVVCALEVAFGARMWGGSRSSLRLSFVLLPVEFAYWLGFALPFGVVLGLARTAAVAQAENRLRSKTDAHHQLAHQ